ncbi:hypothetical protein D9613_011523 [Agrocybe pediades]|uniref:T6SS Phospholipase effector Tle1-like catalytic domain-containing protein n=1 Tax=Agrocybe pediades TaxID=84607 RepID=A0A8H4VQ69_9AGAR|nr:hypothetical protein D9613_011523 [Agrocybe pediades]
MYLLKLVSQILIVFLRWTLNASAMLMDCQWDPLTSLKMQKTNDPCRHGPIDKEKRRNLVISIDGTSNKFGPMNTNVIEHHSLLEDEHQFIGMILHHKIDLAIARDFDKTVMDAYRWISDNYESGDLIFLFGFSRGAFQVRVLSAMIEKVGLLRPGNELRIPFAYELYSDPATNEPDS